MMAADPARDEHIRQTAHYILSRSPYAEWRSFDVGELQGVLRWLRELVRWLNSFESSRPYLYYSIMAGLLLISLLLLVHVGYTIVQALTARPPADKRGLGATAAPEMIEDAAALAQAGHFLAAARQVQLAVIELLLRRRLVDLQRSDANRVLRGRLRTADLPEALRDEMTILVNRLERQWFRDRQEDATLYEAWRRLHLHVEMLREAE